MATESEFGAPADAPNSTATEGVCVTGVLKREEYYNVLVNWIQAI